MTPEPPDGDGITEATRPGAAQPVHEYFDDDYDPEHDRLRSQAHVDAGLDADADGPDAGAPRRSNRARILIGIAGLLAALLLFNVGLDILSEPPDSPTPTIPPRPSTSVAPATSAAPTTGAPGPSSPATSPSELRARPARGA